MRLDAVHDRRFNARCEPWRIQHRYMSVLCLEPEYSLRLTSRSTVTLRQLELEETPPAPLALPPTADGT